MKFLNLLFSIYIVVLSCMPCADASYTIGNKTATFHNETNTSSDKHHDDLCSPFCVCNCCGQQIMTVFSPIVYNFPIKFGGIKTLNSFYTSVFHSNFYGSIWQPPQIV
ncbi:DUF6660 family protein [Flavobacterium sp.]|uniref:DUF6660 family protein n=1 Tax=Flavobacterium sp. TaxID=239 RepID=UPI002B7AB527|nr:DUF6660 family protein [Flavobacterium sp.]HSD09181.1 DUF6660 family protein [Flavobacterium sp.]